MRTSALIIIALPYALSCAAHAATESSTSIDLRSDTEPTITYDASNAFEIASHDVSTPALARPIGRLAEVQRNVTANANATFPCGSVVCLANGSLDTRSAAPAGIAGTDIAHFDAGFRRSDGSVVWGVRAGNERWDVDRVPIRRAQTVVVDAAAMLAEPLSAYGAVTVARYVYGSGDATIETRYSAATASLRLSTADRINSVYSAQATLSQENGRADEPALDSRSALARISWEARSPPGIATRASVLVQRTRFDATNIALGACRNDRYVEFDLGVGGDLAAGLEWRIDATFARYASNDVAFDSVSRSIVASMNWRF